MSAPRSDFTLYRRLLGQARPYWFLIACLGILSVLAAPLTLLTPLPLKLAVDSVIGTQPVPRFLQAVLPASFTSSSAAILILAACLLIAISLLVYLQAMARWLLQTYTGEKLVLDFRAKLFRHAQRLSLSYHDSRGTADSIYRIQYDATSIQSIAITSLIPFATAFVTLAGMVYIMFSMDSTLAVIALPMLPALYLLSKACRRRLREGWTEVKKTESSTMALVQEVLGALRVVKAFGGEDHEQARFVRHSIKGVHGHLRMAFIEGGFDTLIGLVVAIGTASALIVGAGHVRSGQLTLGQLLIVMSYLAQVYAPMEAIGKNLTRLQSGLASAERAFGLLDQAADVVEREHALPLVRAQGGFDFRDVSFAYDRDRNVLHRLSIEIAPGTRVGIAGTTGAGKTTLINLLTRFYDPTAGRILLDGIDLRDYRLADLRNQFAIVLQEPVLFSSSIAENIAYARPDASDDEIKAAASAANAHQFIESLPQGYNTQVGERGLQLSGGERQRVSLARAFLKDAPILILDEPTSSVDVKTEATILEAMERLMHGRTSFIIAHRLDTLRNCELRMQIEDGRLVSTQLEMKDMTEQAPKDHAVGVVESAL